MKEKLILIGGGGHCRACIDVIEQEGRFEIVGILDRIEKIGEKVLGYEIIGADRDLPGLVKPSHFFLITIGQIKSAARRIELFDTLKRHGAQLPAIISPRAYVSRHAMIGEGTIVMHDALVNAGASVGRNCIINTKALIEHDASIGDHCHVSTGAVVNGGTVIESAVFFGSNAVSQEYATVRKERFVRASELVKRSAHEASLHHR